MRMFKRTISFDEDVPHGWGVAYYSGNSLEVVCMPLPFSFIVYLLRKAYFRMVFPGGRPDLNEQVKELSRLVRMLSNEVKAVKSQDFTQIISDCIDEVIKQPVEIEGRL